MSASTWLPARSSGSRPARGARARRALAAVLIVLLAGLYAHRFGEINEDIAYSIKEVQVGEPAQSNLGDTYDGTAPTITVESFRELSEAELSELTARPSLAGYLGADAHIVMVLASIDKGEGNGEGEGAEDSGESLSSLYLQSGITSWQCDPMLDMELAEDPLPSIAADGSATPLFYLISPKRSAGRSWDELNAGGFSLVTSTWPQRVSVKLGRIEP